MYMVVVHLVHPTSNELNYPDCTHAYYSIYFSMYLNNSEFIPHICHGRHGWRPCKFFWPGVNFYRFNAKNWRKLTKIGVFRCKFRCKLAEIGEKLAKNWQKLAFFGVNFILQKFCLCKKMTNMRYVRIDVERKVFDYVSALNAWYLCAFGILLHFVIVEGSKRNSWFPL